MARMLYAHLVQIVGDLRPHVITNVNLGKRTSMLMKVRVLLPGHLLWMDGCIMLRQK